MAGVSADLPRPVCQELSRHCLRKGVWSKLLPPGRALLREHGMLPAADELPEDCFRSHPLWDLLARALQYKVCWRRKIRRRRHINVSELDSYVIDEQRLANRYQSLRWPYGGDSQVALGAIVKGRAASAHLNKLLRRTMCFPLGADLYSLPVYYNTASNRADGPTRDTSPAEPDMPLPDWWHQLCAGDHAGFDAWMKRVGAPNGEADLPFADLCGQQDLELKTARSVRRKAWHTKAACKANQGPVPVQLEKALFPFLFHGKPAELPSEQQDCGRREYGQSLCAEAVELLEALPKDQFFFAENFGGFVQAGALDLFSGTYGVARQLVANGAPWVLCFEINHSAEENLLLPHVRELICRLVLLGAVLACCAAPICSSFSVAVTPPVRSARFPRGLPGLRLTMREKVREGNSHNDFMADLVELFESCVVGYTIENPDLSWWWRQKRWKRWRRSDSEDLFRLCFCRFGCAWMKATRVATNTRLKGKRMMCNCSKPHIRLRGMHPVRKIPWTVVAQPYPRGLSRLLALALCQHAGWKKFERLNVAACSKTGSLRPGEASNPGPRVRPVRREGVLSSTELLTAQTLQLEAKQLKVFCDWCRNEMPDVDLVSLFSAVPLFLCQALVKYADELYASGGALSNLRHLILAAQRWIPGSRPTMQPAWDMVERWESLMPVQHRTPVPEALVQCLCVLAWQLKWYSWVGATVLAFYGAGRLGEVLRCSREDLVLPNDALEPVGSPVFLRLRNFKSRMRQPAKVQHMKVHDPAACALLVKIFRNLDYDSPLFASTSYQYRRRWDFLLEKLGIQQLVTVTPGGLRGGAAVYHYKAGKPIQDLLWLMRLRSQTTLEAYLQEVAALNTFSQLPKDVRDSILLTASCFAFLASGNWDTAAQGKAIGSIQEAWRKAMLLLEAFPANVQTFTSALCSIPADCWHAAVYMLEPTVTFCQRRCLPALPTYNAAMDVCGKRDRWSSSMLLFYDMAHGTLQPDIISSNTVLNAAGARWRWALFALQSPDIRTDGCSLCAAMRACAKGGRWEIAEALQLQIRSIMATNSMLAAWAVSGLWQRSLARWSCCDVVGCNAALSATERSQEWPLALQLILDVGKQRVLKPTLVTQNTLMGALAGAGRWQMAVRALKLVDPDGISFNMLLRAFDAIPSTSLGVKSRWRTALQVLGTFITSRLRPRVITFSSCVSSCATAGQWRWALFLEQCLEGAGLVPSIVTREKTLQAAQVGRQVRLALLRLNKMEQEVFTLHGPRMREASV
eukprot:s3434_g3.t1